MNITGIEMQTGEMQIRRGILTTQCMNALCIGNIPLHVQFGFIR